MKGTPLLPLCTKDLPGTNNNQQDILMRLFRPSMEDKNPWSSYWKPSFHIHNMTNMYMCCIICTSLTAWIPRIALPSSFKQCWDEQTLLGQSNVYRGVETTAFLGGEGKGGKLRQIVFKVLRMIDLYCSLGTSRKTGDNIVIEKKKKKTFRALFNCVPI